MTLNDPNCDLCRLLLVQSELTVEEIDAYHRGELEWQTFPKRVQELLIQYWDVEAIDREDYWDEKGDS